MKTSPCPGPQAPDRRHSRGFTILEVVMATAVMSMGIATSIIAMQQGFKFLDVARGTTLASQILQSEIERIRMMSWGTVTTTGAHPVGNAVCTGSCGMMGTHPVNLATVFTTDPALAAKFTVTRTVTADATRPSDVVHINLTVTWNTFDGRAQTRSFETKYIKNGLYDYYYTLANPAP